MNHRYLKMQLSSNTTAYFLAAVDLTGVTTFPVDLTRSIPEEANHAMTVSTLPPVASEPLKSSSPYGLDLLAPSRRSIPHEASRTDPFFCRMSRWN
ncbi:uncharacterized protein RCC_09761 [Ramularia collo-cygni]|uniref:Uncharacterized protein n=1 Tax=Ramularia collo-cygni TaxID=112498 RepID=A0A2D3VMN1_9PEZI|nr:uncharacterized protein RCC_09761 [Ramularia collo-cygni]CZT24044.1 uncharacterized protein RCC_09761 [Ramularia collo-cygni]